VIGDLAFGESFNCLQNSQYHAWIKGVSDNIKLGAYLRCTLYYPQIIRPFLKLFIPGYLTSRRAEHMKMTREKALHRLNLKTDRVDLIARLAAPGSGVSEDEFIHNCGTVIVAGSGTTANLLAGVTHFLSQNRRCYNKLAQEIRSAFRTEDEMTLEAVNSLAYLSACLTEAMRRYPPTPAHLPRRTNIDDELAGRFVPKNVRIVSTPL
jgi:cytochrome P450